MKFWKFVFCLFMWLCIPYKITKIKYKNNDIVFIHVYMMPWAMGMTIGNWIFTTYSPEILASRKKKPFIHHEFIHYKQWNTLGWKFIPLYIGYSLRALFTGKRPYFDNELEKEAYRAEEAYRKANGFGYYTRYKDE